jgi:hypothetical protein
MDRHGEAGRPTDFGRPVPMGGDTIAPLKKNITIAAPDTM